MIKENDNMVNKKILFFLIIFFISITAVSAANVTDSSIQNSNNLTTNNDCQSQVIEHNERIINETSSVQTNNVEKSSVIQTSNSENNSEDYQSQVKSNTLGENTSTKVSNNLTTNTENSKSVNLTSNTNTNTIKSVNDTASDYSDNTTSKILKQNITIKTNNITAHAGEQIFINATVKTVNGTNVNNVKAVAKINGKTIANGVIQNGTVRFNYTLPSWHAKIYNITIKVGDTHTTNNNQVNSTLSIYKLNTVITTDNLTFAQRGKNVTLVAHVNDNLTNTVNYNKVAFKINGKTIGTANVINGTATINYKVPSTANGIYNITIIYGENTLYKSAVSNTKLKVIGNSINSFTQEDILKAANTVKLYKQLNKTLPKYVMINNTKVSMSDLLYLMCQSLNSNSSLVQGYFNTPTVTKDNMTNGKIYESEYLALSKTIVNFMSNTAMAPGYTNTSLGTISFNSLIDLYSRVLSYQYNYGGLPHYVRMNSTISSVNSSYLNPSANCQSNDSRIISLAQNLTNGKNTTWTKAVAIFNYVRDNIKLIDESNTKYGAVGALTKKEGTDCDKTHLVIALLRASGIPAKYVQGLCKFTYSNMTVNHIWANAYINGKWITADVSSYRNSLNNTKNCVIIGTTKDYASLPF